MCLPLAVTVVSQRQLLLTAVWGLDAPLIGHGKKQIQPITTSLLNLTCIHMRLITAVLLTICHHFYSGLLTKKTSCPPQPFLHTSLEVPPLHLLPFPQGTTSSILEEDAKERRPSAPGASSFGMLVTTIDYTISPIIVLHTTTPLYGHTLWVLHHMVLLCMAIFTSTAWPDHMATTLWAKIMELLFM